MSRAGICLLLAAASAFADDVLLLTRRAGSVEILDRTTLATIARLDMGTMTEGVTASSDGRTLFVSRNMRTQPRGCCALFAVDMERRDACFLIEPAMVAAPAPKGERLFTQRGNVGIEVFDGQTLMKLPTMRAPSLYRLLPSPDGKWLFGVSGGEASLDMFDLQQNALMRQIRVPAAFLSGAWMGDRFFLYGSSKLWTLTPQSESLGAPMRVELPGVMECEVPGHQLLVSGSRLFLYQPFGMKLDPRASCGKAVAGGFYEIDPLTGASLSHVAEPDYFMRLAIEGGIAYGIDIGGRTPRLVSLDVTSGRVLAERVLEDDVWNMALADIPAAIMPHGNMTPAANSDCVRRPR